MTNNNHLENAGRREGEPEIPIKLEDVVLYDGSLDELNAHNPREQYVFADKLEFMSSLNSDITHINGRRYDDQMRLTNVRMELAKLGYIGLVNKRILLGPNSAGYYRVYGTPIVREKPKAGGRR